MSFAQYKSHYQVDKFMWNYSVTGSKEWNKNKGNYIIYFTDVNIE